MTQIRQKIIKLGEGRFRVFWDEQRYLAQALSLDFNPIIQHFKLDALYSDFVLLHWQARPVGLRRWGMYHRKTDQYYGSDWDKVEFDDCHISLLQIDELKLVSPPSAVVLLPNHCITREGNIVKCEVVNELARGDRGSGDGVSAIDAVVDAEETGGTEGGEERVFETD